MHTMDQDLARLVRDGAISHEAASAYAHDAKDLERLVPRSRELARGARAERCCFITAQGTWRAA